MTADHPRVALVGAGPGDPELLTLRAEALLGLAGVVVVDRGLAELARRFAAAAEVVAVPDDRPAEGALFAALARATGPVVRLYRGDPWLHPAHQVERAALARAGLPFEAVAGVAVELAVPALSGVAVHVRRLAVACTLGAGDALPVASDPARTLVASGPDPAATVRAVAADGDGRLPVALVPLADPQAIWRGALAGALGQVTTMAGPSLLVVGAVCRDRPDPATTGAPVAARPQGGGTR